MRNGWFAVKRGITSHHVFKGHPERLAVWMWLLDNAAWKDTRHDVQGKTVSVPRGSICASTRHIATECGVGHQVVRTALARFKDEHMINTQVTHGKTVITLCNYDKYQSAKATTNTQTNTPLTHEQHTPNTQKEQGNKETRVSDETLAREALEQVASSQIVSDFLAHRKAMKKPVTERAAKAMVKKLDGHHDPDAVLTDSIANGWQGIFPEKTKPSLKAINGGSHDRPASKSQRRIQAWTQGARGAFGSS